MRIQKITIQNFRGIKSLELPLDDLTVMIGENNAGKTTVLEAIRLCLTRGLGTRKGQLSEYDFHLESEAASPQTAPNVCITLHFCEQHVDEWPDAVSQQMDSVMQLDATTGLNSITLRVEGSFDVESRQFDTEWKFLNIQGIALRLANTTPLVMLQKFVPLFFLSALRDASQEFGQRGQFWGGFLKSVDFPADQRARLEEMLKQVNDSVVSANAGFQEVIQQISNAGNHVPLASTDPVVLEAIPTRLFDTAGKIQVFLRSKTGAKLPLVLHGEGTKSLSVLLLFQAFTAVNLKEVYEPESEPVLALEEPEGHLHPSAVRSLGSYLAQLPGQILVASHSGDLVSRVPITSLRRLYKVSGETRLGLVPSGFFSDRELQAIDYGIRLTRGAFLFSRSWLLAEGETEFHLLPLLAEIMGHTQDHVSYSVIEISQAHGEGEPFIRLAKTLGIEWFMLADGDAAGQGYVARAQAQLPAGEVLADRARQLVHPDIEHEFWHGGFEAFMRTHIPANAAREAVRTAAGDAAKQTKALIKSSIKSVGGKPAMALALASEAGRRGEASIPQSVRDVITRVVQLAGG